jgi:6,7-dimethyl-8-ribityllumazine synthase
MIKKILIINADYYKDISFNLCLGAIRETCIISSLSIVDEKNIALAEQVISKMLYDGEKYFSTNSILDDNNQHEIVVEIKNVGGCLEIPLALARYSKTNKYNGYVVLGCVIRGQTTHYETVCNESNRAIMNIATENSLALGNGILTTENLSQANQRARYWMAHHENKGGFAMRACLDICNITV